MRRFIVKILYFSTIPVLSLIGVFLLENGTSDPFYQRFATPRQSSLILGSSRAAQGIKPTSINSVLGLEGDSRIFNYSFTIMNSPFGEIYSKSIYKKLRDSTSDRGLFILAVDPWMISSDRKEPDDVNLYREKDLFLDKLVWVSGSMNFQYLLQFYGSSLYEIVMRRFIASPIVLHLDGWLEVTLNENEAQYRVRRKEKIEQYLANLHNSSFSNTRFQSFLSLIAELQKRGKVYLVRLPVDRAILSIEQELMPEFDSLISGVSRDLSVPFLDLSPEGDKYKYTDGNHLRRESAEVVSLEIADWIKATN